MNLKRFLALALSLCMLLTLAHVNFASAAETEELVIEKLDENEVSLDLAQSNTDLELEQPEIDENESVKVIIVMEGESIIEEDCDAVMSPAVQTRIKELEENQTNVMAQIQDEVLPGDELEINYQYTWLLNGVATQVPYGSIAEIEAMEGVQRVILQPVYSVCETAVPDTITDGVMIGRESAWAGGYTGEGMKIAIVDTGLDTNHQNFQALSQSKLTDTSANEETVSAVLSQLNASDRYSGLSIADVYYNTKVVFGFNYCDSDLDITHADGAGDHGTHVAGIAAANKVSGSDVQGVAPDAQLYIMKVFGKNGGAYTEDILAALEDALILGADVVNMSLGTPGGFTSSVEEVNAIYNRVSETNTVLTVSAGNNYSSGYDNNWGTNANLTSYPDNGVLGAPGTYANVMTVASVENWMIQKNYIQAGDYKIGYNQSSNADIGAITDLTGEYELVVIPGVGEAADYEGLDVTGKVALVQRGEISFTEKHMNAEAAGAIAMLAYNNTTGEFGMDLTGSTAAIPAVAISMADGAYLVSTLEEDPALTVSFPAELGSIPSETAYEMSDFSSWGAAPDLRLEPDITAPGGNIYSTLDGGQYGLMSGTSMAAPNVAGMSALVLQYVKENFGTDTDYRVLAQDLLVSTSIPLTYDEETGLAYSPRLQGSGLANVYNAVTTTAYLTVDGSETAKVSLGDDAAKTGAYSYAFNVHNFGDSAVYYRMETSAQTEDYVDYSGICFMSGTPAALNAATAQSSESMVLTYDLDSNANTDSHDAYYLYRASVGEPEVEGWESESFRYDLDGNDAVDAADVQAYLDALVGKEADADLEDTVLQVKAGETAVVTVDVTLDDADKTYFDTYYPNGCYVEGFTTLTALHTNGVDLSLPYMGFYGDWNASPVLDNGSYWDYYTEDYDDTQVVGNQYPHVLFTQFGADEYGAYPGLNAYVEEPFDMAHMSLSPNGDGYMDTLSDMYISLMRNASTLTFRFSNQETGEVYYEQTEENVSKSVYSATYNQVIPYVYSWMEAALYDFTDGQGNDLQNNTQLLLEAIAVGVGEGDEPETWAVPITIDLEAPELLGAKRVQDPDTGKVTLELTFRDNLSASVVALLNSAGTEVLALDGVADTEPDENGYQNYTVSYDITDLSGKVIILLSDYALNESYYGINLGGEGASYGDLVAYQYNFSTGVNGWVSFSDDVAKNETTIFTNYEMDFVAAEYVNGFVYAQTENGALYGFKYTDMLNNTLTLEDVYITQLDNVYQDLAYSYYDGKLYGLLTYEEEWYGEPSVTTEVYSINIQGEYYDEDMWSTVAPYQEDWVQSRGDLYGLGLAIDDDGSIYILGQYHENLYDEETWEYIGTDVSNAQLWKASFQESWGWVSLGAFRLVGDTGMSMDFLQSMTWDHNTEKILWTRFDGGASFIESELIEIDPTVVTEDENGSSMVSAAKVGDLSGETCALFAPLTEETAATHTNVPEMDENVVGTPILRDSTVTMNLFGTKTLGYDIDPWYASIRDVVWSSSDDSIVTVSQNGTITAVGEGSAVITVAAASDETKFDTCTVEVSALTLKLEGIVSAQGAGVGNVSGAGIYEYVMDAGVPTMNGKATITASDELNYGLSLATSEYGRGSIWACEYGNTGMLYEIDAATGEVKDVLEPIDGDMMLGMHYSEQEDTFTAIMNYYLYVDLPMTHELEDEMMASYDEEQHMYTWHRLDMLECLQDANDGFITGETGQGASSEIVFCGITGIDGGIQDAWGETYYYDTYKDYLGNWAYGGECSYQPDQTLILLDNVGRLWYINEVTGVTVETDDWGNVFMTTPDGGSIDATRNGVISYEYLDENGNATYSVFHITQIVETPLTDMFREGTMPRITYHFSDIEFAGYTAEGDPMIAMSLYDYWNNGTTNELYLFIPGHETDEMDYETWEYIRTPDRLYNLGNTGENNIIASIHSAEVTGGVDKEAVEETVAAMNKLAAGIYSQS